MSNEALLSTNVLLSKIITRSDIITGDAFKDICDDHLDEDKRYIDISKKPKIIFLKTDWIELFKAKVLPRIDYTFKLVTHNGDRPAPSNHFDLLEDSRLLEWYGMNLNAKHPKLHSIPIGIANEKWAHGDKNALLEVISEDIKKVGLVYCNYDISTNLYKRQDVFDIVRKKGFIDTDMQKRPYKDYLKKLKGYKYVISPPGNSVDCHRIWESIYLGVIPIVESHLALESYKDLPIMFIDSFNNITLQMLESNYNILTQRPICKALLLHYKELLVK